MGGKNRIVVDYGDFEGLILLAAFDNKNFQELSYEELSLLDGFELVKKYDGINDIRELKKLEENNKEGFVIKFQNGFRLKVKFQEYCRLHKILTQVSNKTVWEYLSQGKEFDELLDRVPDEFYNWVKETKTTLEGNYKSIEEESNRSFHRFHSWNIGQTRADFAEYAKKQKYPAILFKMLDRKDYSGVIWRYIKPEFEKPFANND